MIDTMISHIREPVPLDSHSSTPGCVHSISHDLCLKFHFHLYVCMHGPLVQISAWQASDKEKMDKEWMPVR
jgi:hypothetical protein